MLPVKEVGSGQWEAKMKCSRCEQLLEENGMHGR